MTQDRFQIEKKVLNSTLPSSMYIFKDMDTDFPYLLCAARTNNEKLYTLRIELDQFPQNAPKVFVCKMLKTKTGGDMSDYNVDMHTCESENGRTRIGFCYDSHWTPNRSITWVYFKCLLWLNIYELHLQTGEMMSVYIAHQQTSFPDGLHGISPLEIDESESIVKTKETKKLDGLNIEMENVNLQNICNIIRVAQYGSLDEMRYTLDLDIHKGVLKPVLLEQKTHLGMVLRDAFA